MTIDDLKSEWNAGLPMPAIQLSAGVQRNRVGRSLNWYASFTLLELLLNLPAPLLLGAFMSAHLREPRFLIPALSLELVAMLILISGIRRMGMLRKLDLSAPVLIAQAGLERIRIERIRSTLWILLISPLLWTPLMIVALQGLLGVDAYAVLGSAYLVANLLFGAGLIPLAIWASRRFSNRIRGSRWLQRLMDEVAGYNLKRAKDVLQELAALERETV